MHCLKMKMKVKSLSYVQLFVTPRALAYQVPPSIGFSRQEYWSGLPLPSPNTLSRLVITFLSRSKCLLISWLQSLSAGEGNGTPPQYSRLENPMDGGTWKAAVHGVAKSQIQLSDFTFTFHFHALEKEMATHSSVLAWRIPGTGEPGGLPSMGLHRVGHDWNDLAAVTAVILEPKKISG